MAAASELQSIVIRILTAARDLVQAGWSQGSSARTKNGWAIAYYRPEACRFCPTGAVNRAMLNAMQGSDDTDIITQACFDEMRAVIRGYSTIPAWNDVRSRRKGAVVAMMERAIKHAGMDD